MASSFMVLTMILLAPMLVDLYRIRKFGKFVRAKMVNMTAEQLDKLNINKTFDKAFPKYIPYAIWKWNFKNYIVFDD